MRKVERKFFAAVTFPLFLVGAAFGFVAQRIEWVPVLRWLVGAPALLLMAPYLYFSEDSGP